MLYDKNSRGAEAYMELAKEFLEYDEGGYWYDSKKECFR
jgi:chromosome partitioning protein